uniref:RHS repeat-associated core domain-containing protein n=1 Tax=Pseudomonas sp. UMAB-08 TaxID=1365375 RepID=UPI00214AE743
NGEPPDPVTGHYLLGNGYRAFNPALMRFNSPDSVSPFGEGGLNGYAYCGGDPVNRADPTGHFASRLFKFIGDLSKALKTPTSIGASVTNNTYFNRLVTTAVQSLTQSTSVARTMSPSRRYLNDIVGRTKNPPPFVQKLKRVNQNLASHGDDSLSMTHAKQYGALAQQVSSGEISNTSAHLKAAGSWAEQFNKDRRPSAIIGISFNLAGALGAGSEDASALKTGQSLRRAK